jgi:hypothetical protein
LTNYTQGRRHTFAKGSMPAKPESPRLDGPGACRKAKSAASLDEAREAQAATIERRLRTGRPLAEAEWSAGHEAALGRPLAPRKPGRKPRADGSVSAKR